MIKINGYIWCEDVVEKLAWKHEVEYKLSSKPTHHFVLTLSDELTKAVRKATQSEGVSMQTLVNLWVQERLQKYQAAS